MSSDPKVEEIRARLAAATPGPWEMGDWWHIQGATFCQCRPEWGPAVVQNMRINGTRMLAHRHRLPAPMGTNVINTEPYKDGFPRAVVITTDEYGPIDDTDGEFIANAPTDIALLLTKLDEAEKGLFDIYVALGFDTDGARTAREFFGPIVGETPAEVVVKASREFRADAECEADAAEERERALIDQLRALVERANTPEENTFGTGREFVGGFNDGKAAIGEAIATILSRLLPSTPTEEGKRHE